MDIEVLEDIKVLATEYKKRLRMSESESLLAAWSYYGAPELTLAEIGDLYGITRERVRQIEEVAMRKIKSPELSKAMRRYLSI